MEHLSKAPSNHSPLLFSFSIDYSRASVGFRFENMWLNHKNFLNIVQSSWEQSYEGNVLATKHKTPKASLRTWNKEVFGHLHLRHNISQAEDNAQKEKEVYETDASMMNRFAFQYA